MDDWDEDDWGHDDEAETVPCPSCGTDVYEDAPACPVCGEYITTFRSPMAGMPRWFAILGVIGTLILVAMLIVG